MSLVKANLVVPWISKNAIFDLHSPLNRDSTFDPYYYLRKSFLFYNIELNTSDVNNSAEVVFQLHQNVQKNHTIKPNYLLLIEPSMIRSLNNNQELLLQYRKIFTWNDSLIDGERYIKINLPNSIFIHNADGFLHRDHFCCLIAGNKNLSIIDERNLYLERVKTIRWFEQNAPLDFDLYGTGWDMPALNLGIIGKFELRLWRILNLALKLTPFPSYRGRVTNKRQILEKTRYAICYENVRDLPGYITEKIFDCFFSGCIPVYWGASNITDYIPADCFIDRRQFVDTEALYIHIKKITEEEFIGYQERIAKFLQSDTAYQFSSEFFAETIANTIVQDIGI